MSNTFCRIRIS